MGTAIKGNIETWEKQLKKILKLRSSNERKYFNFGEAFKESIETLIKGNIGTRSSNQR